MTIGKVAGVVGGGATVLVEAKFKAINNLLKLYQDLQLTIAHAIFITICPVVTSTHCVALLQVKVRLTVLPLNPILTPSKSRSTVVKF